MTTPWQSSTNTLKCPYSLNSSHKHFLNVNLSTLSLSLSLYIHLHAIPLCWRRANSRNKASKTQAPRLLPVVTYVGYKKQHSSCWFMKERFHFISGFSDVMCVRICKSYVFFSFLYCSYFFLR